MNVTYSIEVSLAIQNTTLQMESKHQNISRAFHDVNINLYYKMVHEYSIFVCRKKPR